MSATIDPQFLSKPHVRPLGDMIVVRRANAQGSEDSVTAGGLHVSTRVSAGGIDIPDIVDNEAAEFVVVALGDGYVEGCATCHPHGRKHHFEVAIGDRVLVTPWAMTSISLDSGEFELCSERDVLAVFR